MDLSGINVKQFYEKYLKLESIPSQADEYRALCPFHGDTSKPNLTINTKKGVYICFACNESGNIVDFFKKHTGKSAYEFAVENDVKTVEKEKVEDLIKKIQSKKDILLYLKEHRGYTEETIKAYKIGWDDHRITIPVLDKNGVVANVRRYDKDDPTGEMKMISYTEKDKAGNTISGWGKMAIYGERDLFDNDKSILCAGEWDRILLKQNGFNAWCVTGGEGSWNKKWNDLIIDKEISIAFDCDKAGVRASKRIAGFLFGKNKIKIIDLKLGIKEDITDWFVRHSKTKEELTSLINDSKYFIKEDTEYKQTVLALACKSEYYNEPITFKTIVAGKDLAPYQVPKVIEMQCDQKKCVIKSFCSLKKEGYKRIEITDRETILELIGVSKSQLIGTIKKTLMIPKCGHYYISKEIKQNVEEIKLIPEIEFAKDEGESEYVVRKAYSMGDGIKTNQTYVMYGTTLPDPKNQQVIHFIDKSLPSQDNIEEFKVDDAMKKQLQKFQPKNGIQEKLDSIYTDFEANVTHIYKRKNLMLAVDLTYHSVLSFDFLGEDETRDRGWTQLFILGDTRTGKTRTVNCLVKHYKAGERISAENTTLAGLVAGVQQLQGRWTIMWGRIPLNDRRLLIIDEAGGLDQEDYANLSDIRSSGIAYPVKVQTQKTRARTRLIFMANPPKRRLAEYSYGVLAIKKIIGQNEDVARLDLAISCSDTDVPNDEINTRHKEKIEHTYDTESCHNLVMFAWSRKREDIVIEVEAEDEILKVSKEFGKIYTSIIPLVQGAEIRIKLARLSVALACRLYSTDASGEKVIVRVEHVKYIRTFLLNIYNKVGLDYYSYSQQRKKESTLTDPDYIKSMIEKDIGVIDLLLDNTKYTISDFESYFAIEKKQCKEMLSKFLRMRALKKRNGAFEKTPAFTSFLRDYRRELESYDAEEEDSII